MSKPVLVIGNKNYSSWSLRPWLMLKHAGVDFDEVVIPLLTDGYKEKILRHSPAGKVPVYIDGAISVWDSLAIGEYLAETAPDLWPAERAARARARAVSAEMHAGFGALRGALPMNCRAGKGERRVELSAEVNADIQRIQALWLDCRQHYGFDGPWLFGRFSIADAMYAPVVSRFITYGVECRGIAQDYLATVINDPYLRQWYTDAAREAEIIERVEVGR